MKPSLGILKITKILISDIYIYKLVKYIKTMVRGSLNSYLNYWFFSNLSSATRQKLFWIIKKYGSKNRKKVVPKNNHIVVESVTNNFKMLLGIYNTYIVYAFIPFCYSFTFIIEFTTAINIKMFKRNFVYILWLWLLAYKTAVKLL